MGLICAAFHPRPVLVRLSDLKSNEYRELLGGRIFEPQEENPMIAWRGASRYVDPHFAAAFDMECDALRMVRQTLGLDNLQLMVPFCRTPEEGERVVRALDEHGLSPQAGVPLFLMIELPSNVIEADRFIDKDEPFGRVHRLERPRADRLRGIARRPGALRQPRRRRSPSVRAMIQHAVGVFKERGLEIGICGQAPSDYPDEVPRFLVDSGISSMSVTPDTVLQVRKNVAAAEAELTPSTRAAAS